MRTYDTEMILAKVGWSFLNPKNKIITRPGANLATMIRLLQPISYGDKCPQCQWFTPITWHLRVPDLSLPWNSTNLVPVVEKLQRMILNNEAKIDVQGLLSFVDDHGNRPGVQLLAIIGLEQLPIISYSPRRVGFILERAIWNFEIVPVPHYHWSEAHCVYDPEDEGDIV